MKQELGSKQTEGGYSSYTVQVEMSIRNTLLLAVLDDDRSYVGSSLDRFTEEIHQELPMETPSCTRAF